jgi:hypothetical protein
MLIDGHIAVANAHKVPLDTIRSLKAAIETIDFLIGTVLRLWRHDTRRISPTGNTPTSFTNDTEWSHLRSTIYAIMVRKYVSYAKAENASTKLLHKILLGASINMDNQLHIPGSINTKDTFTLAQCAIWVDLIVATAQSIMDVGSCIPDEKSILDFYSWGMSVVELARASHMDTRPAKQSLTMIKSMMSTVLGIGTLHAHPPTHICTPVIQGVVPTIIPVNSKSTDELVAALINRGIQHQ